MDIPADPISALSFSLPVYSQGGEIIAYENTQLVDSLPIIVLVAPTTAKTNPESKSTYSETVAANHCFGQFFSS